MTADSPQKCNEFVKAGTTPITEATIFYPHETIPDGWEILDCPDYDEMQLPDDDRVVSVCMGEVCVLRLSLSVPKPPFRRLH